MTLIEAIQAMWLWALRWGHTLGHTITKGYSGGGNAEPQSLVGITCLKPQGAQLAEPQAGGAFLFRTVSGVYPEPG